jgi:hypothetical protein
LFQQPTVKARTILKIEDVAKYALFFFLWTWQQTPFLRLQLVWVASRFWSFYNQFNVF